MRLNAVESACAEFEYPLSSDDLLAAIGEETLELQGGAEPLADAIERGGGEDFASATELHETVMAGVGHAAIGRRYYSDRDAPAMCESGNGPVSF